MTPRHLERLHVLKRYICVWSYPICSSWTTACDICCSGLSKLQLLKRKSAGCLKYVYASAGYLQLDASESDWVSVFSANSSPANISCAGHVSRRAKRRASQASNRILNVWLAPEREPADSQQLIVLRNAACHYVTHGGPDESCIPQAALDTLQLSACMQDMMAISRHEHNADPSTILSDYCTNLNTFTESLIW